MTGAQSGKLGRGVGAETRLGGAPGGKAPEGVAAGRMQGGVALPWLPEGVALLWLPGGAAAGKLPGGSPAGKLEGGAGVLAQGGTTGEALDPDLKLRGPGGPPVVRIAQGVTP